VQIDPRKKFGSRDRVKAKADIEPGHGRGITYEIEASQGREGSSSKHRQDQEQKKPASRHTSRTASSGLAAKNYRLQMHRHSNMILMKKHGEELDGLS